MAPEFTRQDLAEFKNPGSLADFSEKNGLSGQEAVEQHSIALSSYRLAKAAELGVTLEDLHDMSSEEILARCEA